MIKTLLVFLATFTQIQTTAFQPIHYSPLAEEDDKHMSLEALEKDYQALKALQLSMRTLIMDPKQPNRKARYQALSAEFAQVDRNGLLMQYFSKQESRKIMHVTSQPKKPPPAKEVEEQQTYISSP